MEIDDIITAIDEEIKRLQQVGDLCQTLLDTDMQPWLAHPEVHKRRKKMSATKAEIKKLA